MGINYIRIDLINSFYQLFHPEIISVLSDKCRIQSYDRDIIFILKLLIPDFNGFFIIVALPNAKGIRSQQIKLIAW
jgi:hypothetical protein